MERPELDRFLMDFANFLVGDARHDLWIRSIGSETTLVWDRHNDVYIYGALETVMLQLESLGFPPGTVANSGPHKHHYRAAFDEDARAVLGAFDWRRTDLKPEDEQLL